MADLNNCSFTGRLTKDPQIKIYGEGKDISKFCIAVNDYKPEDTLFINCCAFDKLAKTCNDYLKKGKLVAISGRLCIKCIEKEGKKDYWTELKVTSMTMLSPKSEGNE